MYLVQLHMASKSSSSRSQHNKGASSRQHNKGASSVFKSNGLCELIDVSDHANPQKCGTMILKNAKDVQDKVPFHKRVVLTYIPKGPGIVGEGVKPLHSILKEVILDRANFPVGVKDWKAMPNEKKNYAILTQVLTKFYIEPLKYKENACHEMKKQMGTQWKNMRTKLWKQYYDETKSQKDNEDTPPDGITKDDWASFITLRFSEKWMDMREKNRENALMNDCHPTSGSRTVAQLYGLMASQNGVEPSRTDIVILTRSRDDGSYPNDSTRDIIERIRGESQQEGVPKQGRDDAVARVRGEDHPGRVLGFGSSGSQSRIFGPNKRFVPSPSFESDASSSHSSHLVTREEFDRQQRQLDQCSSILNFVMSTLTPEQMQRLHEVYPQYRNNFPSSSHSLVAVAPRSVRMDQGGERADDGFMTYFRRRRRVGP